MEINNNATFNVEQELAKVILANCLNGPHIRSGIREKDGALVLISSVKKDGENFYIPISRIAEFLKEKFNEKKEFKDLESIKQSFEKVLFDIYNNETISEKNADDNFFSKIVNFFKKDKNQNSDSTRNVKDSIRLLGIDGLCYYLGKRMDNLPTFKLENEEADKIFKTQQLISDTNDIQLINENLNEQFKTINLYQNDTDNKIYTVNKYPISLEEQKKIATNFYNDDDDDNNNESKIKTYNKSFINHISRECEKENVLAQYVNKNTNFSKKYSKEWLKENVVKKNVNKKTIKKNTDEMPIEKYCNKCNFVPDKCPNRNNDIVIINSSFEINSKIDSNSKISNSLGALNKKSVAKK